MPRINEAKLLIVLSNQKINAYLKGIAAVCKINKVLTFHIVRHTFATAVTLSNGVPIESVHNMLGQRKLRTTQHYAKNPDHKVGRYGGVEGKTSVGFRLISCSDSVFS
jgi:site-specific recombinase XerD